MLINNCYVAVLEEETAAAVYNAFSAITITMVFILSPAAISIFAGILKVDMTFGQPVRVRHFGTRGRGKQNV